MRNSLTVGYDSFIDRFTILEEDTVETLEEFYTGILNHLAHQRNTLHIELRNNFKYGNQTVDENLEGAFSIGSRRSTRLDLRSNLHFKHFRTGSDYTFGNDYLQSNTVLMLKRRLTTNFRLNIKNRFEIIDYDKKTDFDYDYTYIETGLELETGSYFERFVRLGAVVGFKEVPDTTALSYRRTVADLEALLTPADNALLHATVIGDRRDYRKAIKISYWDLAVFLDLTISSLKGRSYSLKAEAEFTLYDSTTTTYFDTQFLRGSVKAKFPVLKNISVSFEPRIAVMLCRDFEEERYREASLVLGLDILGNEDFWVTFSYEPGYRNYILTENDLYSDFYLNRLSLMGTVEIPHGTSLNLFVTHDPERHTRRVDNFSITLISVALTKRF
ncbi:MAG: hypothetical protein JSV33_01045 [bacterium]|nr:MAG: hypothetical protein JSV33_01045 [bacterium]